MDKLVWAKDRPAGDERQWAEYGKPSIFAYFGARPLTRARAPPRPMKSGDELYAQIFIQRSRALRNKLLF
ncbi:MAG: hypothetical protein EBR58_07845 [Betaproteobacteria bacterium]|nr:hypothetical protein [Betaproteobacteria bacterium]